MLAALALSFLAACSSDDDDSDTVTLDDCVAIQSSVLSGTWESNEKILGYATVTLTFEEDSSNGYDGKFTAEVDFASTTNSLSDSSTSSGGEDTTDMTVTGTYELTNGGKSITVNTDNSEDASASTLLFYVLDYSTNTLKLYVKTASAAPFNLVLGQTLTFKSTPTSSAT